MTTGKNESKKVMIGARALDEDNLDVLLPSWRNIVYCFSRNWTNFIFSYGLLR